MKTFGGEPEGRSSKGKMQLHFSWLSPDPAREEGPVGLGLCPSTKGCHTSLNQQLPFPTRQLVYNQLLLATLYLLARENICLHICTFPFF